MPDLDLTGRITIKDAAKRCRADTCTLRRWIRTGTLPALRVGGRWWIWPDDLWSVVRRVSDTGRARGADLPGTRRERGRAAQQEAERVQRVLEQAGLA